MEIARALLQTINNFEEDELEHGAGKCKVGAKHELHRPVTKLVVAEKLLHEEDPPNDEEDHLRRHNHHAVPKETHFDTPAER